MALPWNQKLKLMYLIFLSCEQVFVTLNKNLCLSFYFCKIQSKKVTFTSVSNSLKYLLIEKCLESLSHCPYLLCMSHLFLFLIIQLWIYLIFFSDVNNSFQKFFLELFSLSFKIIIENDLFLLNSYFSSVTLQLTVPYTVHDQGSACFVKIAITTKCLQINKHPYCTICYANAEKKMISPCKVLSFHA